MEALVAHDVPSTQILRLVRLTTSFVVGYSFCIDLNAHGHQSREGVTDAELDALHGRWRGVRVRTPQARPPRDRREGPDAASAAPARRGEGSGRRRRGPAGSERESGRRRRPHGTRRGPDAASAAPRGGARTPRAWPPPSRTSANGSRSPYSSGVSLTPPDLPESFASRLDQALHRDRAGDARRDHRPGELLGPVQLGPSASHRPGSPTCAACPSARENAGEGVGWRARHARAPSVTPCGRPSRPRGWRRWPTSSPDGPG